MRKKHSPEPTTAERDEAFGKYYRTLPNPLYAQAGQSEPTEPPKSRRSWKKIFKRSAITL